MADLGQKAPKVTEVYSDYKDYRAQQDLLGIRDQPEIMVSMANLVNKDLKVHPVWTAMLVLLVFLAHLAQEDLREKKENGVL